MFHYTVQTHVGPQGHPHTTHHQKARALGRGTVRACHVGWRVSRYTAIIPRYEEQQLPVRKAQSLNFRSLDTSEEPHPHTRHVWTPTSGHVASEFASKAKCRPGSNVSWDVSLSHMGRRGLRHCATKHKNCLSCAHDRAAVQEAIVTLRQKCLEIPTRIRPSMLLRSRGCGLLSLCRGNTLRWTELKVCTHKTVVFDRGNCRVDATFNPTPGSLLCRAHITSDVVQTRFSSRTSYPRGVRTFTLW